MAVKEIGHVIHSPSFKVKQDAFVSKYMDQFEFGIEENKLQHTTIHEEYQRLVESWIEEGLGHKYDMRVVEAGIPQLAKSPGDDETAQTIMILTAMTDFLSFKEMMLQSKALLLKQAELSVGAAKALEEQCALIGSADLAWKPILTDPSLQIEKAKDDMGKEILRFSMVVEGTMRKLSICSCTWVQNGRSLTRIACHRKYCMSSMAQRTWWSNGISKCRPSSSMPCLSPTLCT